ncbi:MAG: NERD domain-containing protein [Desulfobulbaceae bacterium]|nr:NERD domain-containing protein [Desulfobulbaceae bacterium]
MVNIIPVLSVEQIEEIPSRAEQKVYKALVEQLPNDCLVVHSLEFIKQTSRFKSHGDREADFVIFSPRFGVLVVEVKGGGISYDNSINQWYSIDRNKDKHEIKNPVRQAKDAKYEIRSHLQQRLGNKKLLLAHAVMFPDIENAAPLVSPNMPINIIGVNRNLIDLKKWVTEIFDYWAGEQPVHDALGENGIKVAEQIYGKQVSIRPSLRSAIEKEVQKQIELTNQQKNILRQLKRRKEAVVEGGAGTGKTVLALDQAQTLADQGLNVLFLCYNQRLGNALKIKSRHIDNLHSMGFHEFCSWRIRQVESNTERNLIEESRNIYPGDDLYDVLMPDALINSYELAPIQYDVILIDEGQDFKPEYWLAIEMLRDQHEDTKLYIFQDSNQAIYTNSNDLPIDCEPLFLFDNCRNTKYIHNSAYQYYKGTEVYAPDLEGEPVRLIEKSSLGLQAKEIDNKISRLINTEIIDPEDIAIVVMGQFHEAQLLLENTKNSHLWAFKEFSPVSKVLVETEKRFKGLESKIIFLWIIDEEAINDKLLYVSISRARFRLWVIGTTPIIQRTNLMKFT